MVDINYMNLADIYKNVNSIVSGQQGIEGNRRLLERDQKKQDFNKRVAPMLKNNDLTGAANMAFDEGDIESGQGFQSQQSAIASAQRKLEKEDFETLQKVAENMAPALYQIGQVGDAATRNEMARNLFNQYSPHMEKIDPGWTERTHKMYENAGQEQFNAGAMRGLKMYDQLKLKLDQEKSNQAQFNTDRAFGASQENQALNRQVQMRGQDVTKENSQWYQAPGPNGLPVWKQGKAEGEPVYSPTGISNKPMTDVQGGANIYAQRMEESNRILENLENTINVPGLAAKQAAGSGVAGAIGNAMLSPEQQMVDQAQRDFINATLRRESGAAIQPTEFESAKLQYFPSVGDSEQVKAQKRRNREIAIKGTKEMAGQNAPVNKQQNQSPSSVQNITDDQLKQWQAEYKSIYGGQ